MTLELAGKYRLICELGQGGMAVVYLAVALGASNFRKLAVVKLIRPQVANETDIIQMFFDEARLSARLNHPNIVQTYDVGEIDGQHFMAMEYLEGASLSATLSHVRPAFPVRAKVLLEVLEGLKYAHQLVDFDGTPLNIVHRDISPHNVFVTYTGHVKVLDFGIAKASTSEVRTATGVIKGKLKYMAPEQALGRDIDARADLFSVGVMLWEAMVGKRRFPADISDVAVFTRVASGEVPETTDAASLGYPPELNEVLKRALAPKREDRYQTAGAFHAELERAMEKMAPCSLRELGASAASAFSEERAKLNAVLERRLRLIETGAPIVSTSEHIPTVRPPRGTASTSLNRELDAPASPIDIDVDLAPPVGEAARDSATPHSGTHRGGVTRPITLRPAARRRAYLGAAALAVVLAGAGAWSVRGAGGGKAGGGSSAQSISPSTATRIVLPESSTIGSPPPPVDAPSGGVPVGPATLATPAGGDRAVGALPRVAVNRSHKASLQAAAPPAETSPPAATASAAPPPASTDRAPVPRAPGPKVQLERDNPWN